MVVEVVAEADEVVNRGLQLRSRQKALLDAERDEARGVVVLGAQVERGELSGGLAGIRHGRAGSDETLGLEEFLKEHSSEGLIRNVSEVDEEDDHNLDGGRAHIHELILAVVHRDNARGGRALLKQGPECGIERSGCDIAAQAADRIEELLVVGDGVAVELDGDVEPRVGCHLHVRIGAGYDVRSTKAVI